MICNKKKRRFKTTQTSSLWSHSLLPPDSLNHAGMYFLPSSKRAPSCWLHCRGKGQPPSHCVWRGPKSKHLSAGNACWTSVSLLRGTLASSSSSSTICNSLTQTISVEKTFLYWINPQDIWSRLRGVKVPQLCKIPSISSSLTDIHFFQLILSLLL